MLSRGMTSTIKQGELVDLNSKNILRIPFCQTMDGLCCITLTISELMNRITMVSKNNYLKQMDQIEDLHLSDHG